MAAVRTNAGFILHFEEEIKAGRLSRSLDDMPKYAAAPTMEAGTSIPAIALQNIPAGSHVRLAPAWETGSCAGFVRDIEANATHTSGKIAHPIVEPSTYIHENGIGAMTESPEESEIRQRKIRRCANKVHQNEQRIVNGVGEAYAQGATHIGGCLDTKSPHFPDPFTVYLCGPITGQDVDYRWREMVTDWLAGQHIHTLDPLRGKNPSDVSNQGLSYKGQLAAPEIAERDRMDIEQSDVVLAHFPYMPPRQSIGSLMEMGAAAIGFKKPVILVTSEKVFNEHLFCRNFCTLEPDMVLALRRIVAMAQVAIDKKRRP
jgi:nucleoside 2-deoxyribosyltransferase